VRTADVRAALASLLQESDPDRPLDSLETVVVLTHLADRALPLPASPQDRPTTIEGWVAWVARHSHGS
jgi:hypothetical protein